MEPASESNIFLDPNFAVSLYSKFGKIRETVPKIKLIIGEFRKRSSLQSTPLIVKNDLKSNELREEADRLSCSKDESTLLRALELYNGAICYAEQSNTEYLAILYARRAGVYFELKEYNICSENILLAEENRYPADRIAELEKLKIDNSEQLRKRLLNRENKGGKTELKLTVSPNQRIPFAARCLELKSDSIRGRYIATNEDISPGSIIIIESPFEKMLNSDFIYQRCSNCLRTRKRNLIPCLSCTKAMFCSDECKRKASEGFHRFECPIIDCLVDVGGQITLRIFLKAIQSFDSMQDLIEFTRSENTNEITAFSFDHSKGLTPQQYYHQIHSLSTNHDSRRDLDLFTHTMVAALFYYQLSCHTPLKDLMNEGNIDCLMELMFRIELITSLNSFNFNDLSSLQDNKIIGTGMYPLSSLINHSCSPNACPKYYNKNLILYTTQTIKRGESVSISYNAGHAFLSKQRRQSFLMDKYHFSCECIACVDDFPLVCDMIVANIPEIHSNGISVLLDKKLAENIFAKCCAYLRDFYENYPCKEVYSVQICLSKLLSYLLMNDDNCPVELCIGKLGNINPKDIIF